MKSNMHNKLKLKRNVLIASGVILCIILAVAVLEMTNITHFFHTSVTQILEQKLEATTDSNNKKTFIDNESSDKTNGQDNIASDITISAHVETNGTVTILTKLSNYSDGICDLRITNNDKLYIQTAPVIYQASFSSCAGFSISTEKLGNGLWQISLKVTSKGKANTKTITAEVQ